MKIFVLHLVGRVCIQKFTVSCLDDSGRSEHGKEEFTLHSAA